MNLLTQLDEEDREAVIQTWKGATSNTVNSRSRTAASRRVSYKESSGSETDEASGSESSPSESENESSGNSDGEDDDSDAQGSTDDEEQLGEAGSAFSVAEKRVVAKHIANCPEWLTGRKEWESFFVAVSFCDPSKTNAVSSVSFSIVSPKNTSCLERILPP